MALTDPQEKRTKQGWVLAVIVLILIIIYAVATQGPLGIKAVLTAIVKISIWVMVLLGVVYAVYKVFFEKKEVNIIANDKQAIINAGKLCKPPLLKDLYFTGDREHGEAKVGHIIGYCQIQTYEDAQKGEAIPEDCFVFKTMRFPFSLFEEAKVFRCLPNEHSELVGDVKIYAISPIEKFGYFFPNHTFLNIRRIDVSVVKEAYRGQIFETFKDLSVITKKATGLDSDQMKSLENRKLLKIPSSMEEQETR
jgi:Ca2+/Na+ antiporter